MKNHWGLLIQKVNQYETAGYGDFSLDLLMEQIDSWFLEGNFEICNQFLEWLPISTLSIDSLVGILVVTNSAKEKLPARVNFYYRVKYDLYRRGVKENLERFI